MTTYGFARVVRARSFKHSRRMRRFDCNRGHFQSNVRINVFPPPAQEIVTGALLQVASDHLVITGPKHYGPTVLNATTRMVVPLSPTTKIYASSPTSSIPQNPALLRMGHRASIAVSANHVAPSSALQAQQVEVPISTLLPGMDISADIVNEDGVRATRAVYIEP